MIYLCVYVVNPTMNRESWPTFSAKANLPELILGGYVVERLPFDLRCQDCKPVLRGYFESYRSFLRWREMGYCSM
jgi:hypothetical protein